MDKNHTDTESRCYAIYLLNSAVLILLLIYLSNKYRIFVLILEYLKYASVINQIVCDGKLEILIEFCGNNVIKLNILIIGLFVLP